LIIVKVGHTLAWAFFVAAILAIPITALLGRFDLAAIASGIVLVEVVILAFNQWHCPLTPIAARYTDDRRANFDIYLPEPIARLNKEIFGPLYVAGMLYALARWQGWIG
jgi:hypothetical protein